MWWEPSVPIVYTRSAEWLRSKTLWDRSAGSIPSVSQMQNSSDNVEWQRNRGLLGFALVAFFGHFWIRFLHWVRTICKITICNGASDTTNPQHSTVRGTFSLHGRLHSETQPRLDASGFQIPTLSAPCRPASIIFPSFLRKVGLFWLRIHQNSACQQLRKSIMNNK